MKRFDCRKILFFRTSLVMVQYHLLMVLKGLQGAILAMIDLLAILKQLSTIPRITNTAIPAVLVVVTATVLTSVLHPMTLMVRIQVDTVVVTSAQTIMDISTIIIHILKNQALIQRTESICLIIRNQNRKDLIVEIIKELRILKFHFLWNRL